MTEDVKKCLAIMKSGMARCNSPPGDKDSCDFFEEKPNSKDCYYLNESVVDDYCRCCAAQCWAARKSR